MKTLDVVLQVTDFFGKLAADGLDAVDFREDGLKFVKSAESLLNRKGLVVFVLLYRHIGICGFFIFQT